MKYYYTSFFLYLLAGLLGMKENITIDPPSLLHIFFKYNISYWCSLFTLKRVRFRIKNKGTNKQIQKENSLQKFFGVERNKIS